MAVRSPAAWALSFVLALGVPLAAVSTAHAQGTADRADGESPPGPPSRAEELARDANKAFDRFLEGEDPRGAEPSAPVSVGEGNDPERTRHAIESGSDWLARVQSSYQALVERLSEATAPNPVADAAERQAAERAKLWARKGEVERAPGDRVVIGEGDQATLIGDARELLDRARREMQGGLMGPLSATRSTGGATAGPSESPGAGEPAQTQERIAPEAPSTAEQTIAQISADVPAVGEQSGETERLADDQGALGWLNRGYRAFQRDVVGKLAAGPKDGATHAAPKEAAATPAKAVDANRRDAGAERPTIIEGTAAGAAKPDANPARDETAARQDALKAGDFTEHARQLEEARRAEMMRKAEKEQRAEVLRAEEATKQAEAERQAEARQAAEAARLAEAKAAEVAKQLEDERQAEARKAAEAAKRAEVWAGEVARRAELRRAAEQRAIADARRAKDAAEHAAAETARPAAEVKAENIANVDASPGTVGRESAGHPSATGESRAIPQGTAVTSGPSTVRVEGPSEPEKANTRAAELAPVAEASARQEAERAATAVKSIEAAKRSAESAIDSKSRRRADRLIEREARNTARAAKRAVAATAALGKVAPIGRPKASSVGTGPIARPVPANLSSLTCGSACLSPKIPHKKSPRR